MSNYIHKYYNELFCYIIMYRLVIFDDLVDKVLIQTFGYSGLT